MTRFTKLYVGLSLMRCRLQDNLVISNISFALNCANWCMLNRNNNKTGKENIHHIHRFFTAFQTLLPPYAIETKQIRLHIDPYF
jgi:hypothetical protein